MMETVEQLSNSPGSTLWRGHKRIRVTAQEVALAGLQASDLLLIQTANSIYSFSVTDEATKGGRLMGGRMGEASAVARLIGAQEDTRNDAGMDETLIAVSSHAVFLVSEGNDSRRLVTSAIKRLIYLKIRNDWS
jgi:hypothetical protein